MLDKDYLRTSAYPQKENNFSPDTYIRNLRLGKVDSVTRDRGNKHDAPASPLPNHLLCSSLGTKKPPCRVDIESSSPIRSRHVYGMLAANYPCEAEEKVDRA